MPVCNIGKAVRQPGQGKQPSAGFRGDGGRDVFPQEPGDPRRLLAGAREGPRGKTIPSVAPHKNTPAALLFMIIIIIIILYLSHLLLFGSFLNPLKTCTQRFFIISLTF